MSRRRRVQHEEELSYWQAYSDMMAALLLMFILIMCATLIQSINNYQEQFSSQIEREEEIQKKEELLEKQQEQIDQLVGIKSELIQVLNEAFRNANLKVMIDEQTGAITFDSNILFDYGKYTLKDQGKAFLNQFLPIYFGVMLDGTYLPYVSEIIVEGHTDTSGSYMYNLELSQQRAFEVVRYSLELANTMISHEQEDELIKIITANGRSMSSPIYAADGTVNMDASRRVEFKFRLKDAEMTEKLIHIFEGAS